VGTAVADMFDTCTLTVWGHSLSPTYLVLSASLGWLWQSWRCWQRSSRESRGSQIYCAE